MLILWDVLKRLQRAWGLTVVSVYLFHQCLLLAIFLSSSSFSSWFFPYFFQMDDDIIQYLNVLHYYKQFKLFSSLSVDFNKSLVGSYYVYCHSIFLESTHILYNVFTDLYILYKFLYIFRFLNFLLYVFFLFLT